MATGSEENQTRFTFGDVKSFPSVTDGKINVSSFLEATCDLITLVGRLGKAFAPVKYDMQGNVDKIKNHYNYDENSCLLELMLDEHSKGKHTAAEGVLWLNRQDRNPHSTHKCIRADEHRSSEVGGEVICKVSANRALLFFELVFQEIIVCLQSRQYDENMTKIFTFAYEGSVKKYHNWITQKLFALICNLSPTLPQIMKSFEIENNQAFETRLISFNATLNSVRCKIDDFFKEHNILNDENM